MAASPLHPPIEPHASGRLAVGGGHALHHEECGRPDGLPVLFLHGGPGSGCGPAHRRFFDPARFRAVLLDQRGCGRSTPRGGIRHNRTDLLIEDLERLRAHLGVERWLVFGGSWGSTLALAYVQAHPERVAGMVLRGIFLCSRAELEWFLEGLQRFIPGPRRELARLLGPARGLALVRALHRRLGEGGEAALAAALAWDAYERAAMALTEPPATAAAPDPARTLDRVRVQAHYLARGGFLAEGRLLQGAAALGRVPGILVQGALDFVCPPASAEALAAAWPGAELWRVEGAGHSAFEPAIAARLLEALDRMADRIEGGAGA